MDNQIIQKVSMKSEMISDLKSFDLDIFIKELKANEESLNEIKNAGTWATIWNDVSGKTSKRVVQSLDLNNKFVKFSIYVNAWLVEMSKKTDQQQQTLSSQQDEMRKQQGELRDTINRVDLSEENLTKAVEKFNLLKDQYDDLDKDREKLINSMESMNKDFNSIKDQVIGDLKSFNEFVELSKIELNNLNESISQQLNTIERIKTDTLQIIENNQSRNTLYLIILSVFLMISLCLSIFAIIN
tara:strand:+ start:506 stop:1231 length:726 start_codon:yes stop_codon:yes gene_type:complete